MTVSNTAGCRVLFACQQLLLWDAVLTNRLWRPHQCMAAGMWLCWHACVHRARGCCHNASVVLRCARLLGRVDLTQRK